MLAHLKNMYGKGSIESDLSRNVFLSKRSLRKGLFRWTPIWGSLTSGGAGGQTSDIWSTSGVPWNLGDITLHSRYVGCRRYQKWLHSRALLFFRKTLRQWKFLTLDNFWNWYYWNRQVPLNHLVRHSSANWIISLFTTYSMSHAQYTWSSLHSLV